MTAALLAALAAAPAVPPPDPPRPTVVLRVSRAFVQSLTRRGFDQTEPVETTQQGADVAGTARVTGGYAVAFHTSDTAAAFELRVTGRVELCLGVTRRPVRLGLAGASPLCATRRVAFDGDAYAGGPVAVGADYDSALTGLDTFRRGPLAPLVRRVAGRVVARALPAADAGVTDAIRAKVRDAVTAETDRVVKVLNAVRESREDVAERLRARGLGTAGGRPALATTDDAMLLGFGFPAGVAPVLPAADGPFAPVEIWVNHRLTDEQRQALRAFGPEAARVWDTLVKPRLVEELAGRSPELARRLAAATHDVQPDFLPAAPGWHRVRFFRAPDDAAP